jgi:hypothetical protein
MTEQREHTDQDKLLGIYLNDHLMGATGGVRLARRTAKANAGTRFGAPLEVLAKEIDEDRTSLRDVMRAVKVPPNLLKVTAAAAAERAGLLKLNGRLTGYSPLSRLVELEGLLAGVNGKLGLWRTLQHLETEGHSFGDVQIDELIARGLSQRERIEGLRLDAAVVAFGSA